ncbi:MAG: SDR family NAD(P)-dependent oxidoreductase [Thermoguttaceae bacterium]|nr:SDR family NAD(P)-dependent oxidoreductase [Thermoguttaceae bacterium]
MRKVFVTGASGFVGLQLVTRLRQEGVSVRCLVRKSSRRAHLEELGVEFVEGDVRDLDALRRGVDGVDTVFHIAGVISANTLDAFLAINRDGCRNVARAISECTGAKPLLVSVSSQAAAGAGKKIPKAQRVGGEKYRSLVEEDAPVPFSPYGKSKLAGEMELRVYAGSFPITILRPAIVFGEGDSATLPLFRIAKRSPVFWIPGFAEYPFSYVYVQDLVTLLIKAAESGERLSADPDPQDPAERGRGIYFVSYPENYKFSLFGKMLGHAVGRKRMPVLRCPPLALLTFAAVAEIFKRCGRHVPLDLDKAREALGGPWICNSEKARKLLEFRPVADLQEEVNRTARWYADRGLL